MAVPDWFVQMLGWKDATQRTERACIEHFGVARGPNLADLGNVSSTLIAGVAYQQLGVTTARTTGLSIREVQNAMEGPSDEEETRRAPKKKLTAAGARLEEGLADDIRT